MFYGLQLFLADALVGLIKNFPTGSRNFCPGSRGFFCGNDHLDPLVFRGTLPPHPFIPFHPVDESGSGCAGNGKAVSQLRLRKRSKGGQVSQSEELPRTDTAALELFAQHAEKGLRCEITMKTYTFIRVKFQENIVVVCGRCVGRLLLLSKLTIFLGRCQGAFLSGRKMAIENRKRGGFLGVADVLGLRRLRRMGSEEPHEKVEDVYGKQRDL